MKKNKPYLFFFASFFISTSLFAQYCDTVSFQKIYWNQDVHDAKTKNIFFSPSDNLYIIGSTESALNGSSDVWIMKTTPGGKPIFSKAIGMIKDETINGVRNTTDGGFIVAGSTNSFSTFDQGWIAKIDSNGIVKWSVVLGVQYSSLSQITELSDGGYAAVGTIYTQFDGDSSGKITSIKKSTNLIITLDKNGNTVWWKSFRYNNRETLKTVAQLNDGALLVTGNVNESNEGYIIKMKKENGDIIWMNEYQNPDQSTFGHATEEQDGSLHLHVANLIYFLSANGKFDEARKIELNSNQIQLDNAEASDIGDVTTNTEVYFANLFPQHSPLVFAVQNDALVTWAHVYKADATNLQRINNGRIYRKNIYIAGLYVTDNFSDNQTGDNLTYLIKSDMNGYTLCSDTFNISFKIITSTLPASISHEWSNEGSINLQAVNCYTEDLSGNITNDCAVQNCCRDTTINKTVSLCSGSSYTLPNDSIIKTSGLYSLQYQTWAGCDSMLKYNVQFQKPLQFSLGDDTCLINNIPVSFSLSQGKDILYKWQDGSSANNYTVNFPGKYWVTATTQCGSTSDTVTVNALCSMPVYLPSAFTPNKDGLNDIFRIANLNGQHLNAFVVYNRFGQKIFLTQNLEQGWDGKMNSIDQPTGTYIYFIRYLDFAGTLHVIKGTVVLIR